MDPALRSAVGRLPGKLAEAVTLDRMTRSVVAFYGISDYRPEGR